MAYEPTIEALDFAEGLTAKFGEHYTFEAIGGVVRDKIVQHNVIGAGGSVHAFVCRKTGGVLKAEGYNKPARGIRYPTVADALAAADPHGGYLYARR